MIQFPWHYRSTWQNRRHEYNTLISPSHFSKIFTNNHTHPLCDPPCKFNGLSKFFQIPKNQGTRSWKARQQNLDTNRTQTQTFEKSYWLLSKPLELLIIPLPQPSKLVLRYTLCLHEYIAQWIVSYFSSKSRSKDFTPTTSPFHYQNKNLHYLYSLQQILPSLLHEISAKHTSPSNSLATPSSCI
jgi:hypothetical protein